MAELDDRAGYVVPSPRILKVLGILNIVFASALILGGLCLGAYTAMLPALSKAMNEMQKKAIAEVEKRQKDDLQKIDEDMKKAETDAEKTDLEAQRKAILDRPKNPLVARTSTSPSSGTSPV